MQTGLLRSSVALPQCVFLSPFLNRLVCPNSCRPVTIFIFLFFHCLCSRSVHFFPIGTKQTVLCYSFSFNILFHMFFLPCSSVSSHAGLSVFFFCLKFPKHFSLQEANISNRSLFFFRNSLLVFIMFLCIIFFVDFHVWIQVTQAC